ncbi:hypothetical protein BDQ17DRAFT_366988 [Cyathus striatus]|nr:hypothetical protein BDQ17DRAFT_366988 [Cyathus striatus]
MVDMKSIFFAERALVHAREHEREIRSTLEEFGVRNYTICAGFNEDYLSKRQHLEEINIRIYESIHASKDISSLLDSLGKIFFPFHGSVDWHSTIVPHWPITITLGPKNNRGEIPGASLDMGLDSLSILGRSENPGEKGSRLGGNEDDKARGFKKCPTVSFRVSAEHPVPNPDKKTQNIEIYSGSMTTMSVAFAYPELVQSTHGMGKVTIEFRELNFHHKSIGHDMYYLAAVVVLVKPKDTYLVSSIYYEDSYIRPDDGDKSTSSLAVNNSWFISSRSRVAERSVEWIFRRIGNGSGQQGVDPPKRDFWSLLNPKDRDIEVDLPKMGFEFLLNPKDQLYVNIKVVSYWSLAHRVPEGISKTCLSNFCQIGNFKISLKSVIQTQRIERHYTSPGNSRLDYSRFDEYIDSATVTITPTRFHAGTPVQCTARDFFEPQLGTNFISKKIENITGGLELMGSKYSDIINVPLPNEEIIPERDSFSTLKSPISNEGNCSQQLKGFIDLIYAGGTEEISWQSLFYAKRAFKHAIQKEAIIRSILFYIKIESCTICAGFNEFLISNGGGHLEEIGIYIDKSTQVDPGRVPSLLNLLGDVFSPFPGLIYIGDSDPIPTPVLNEYGSQRDHDDIYFTGIDQIGDRQSNGTRPIILTCNNSNGNEQANTTNDKGEGSDSAAEDPPEGEGSGGGQNPPPGSSGRGNSEQEDNYGGGSGDRKKGTSKAQKAVSPKVHFSIDALISDGETEYDTLKHIGTLSMRVGLNFQVSINCMYYIMLYLP